MKTLGHKTIPLHNIILPGDWHKIEMERAITKRAQSIEEVGLLHEPIVRKVPEGFALVSGRHRLAAMIHLGWKMVPCKVVDCDRDEAEDLAFHENFHRRHYTNVELAELCDAYRTEVEERLRKRNPDVSEKTISTELYREVAKQTGVKPRTVKNARYARDRMIREKDVSRNVDHKTPQPPRPRKPPPPLPPGFQNLGMEIDETESAEIGQTVAQLDRALKSLGSARGAIMSAPRVRGEANSLAQRKINDVIRFVRRLVPNSVCPWCKGMPIARAECTACLGSGTFHVTPTTAVPEEFLDADNPILMYGGQTYEAHEFFQKFVDPTTPDDPGDDEEDPFG